MKNRKITISDKCIFYGCLGISFFAILFYNLMTPYMTDDLSYKAVVDTANSFWDLFKQEYEHYLYHTGRNVAHFLLRIFLSQPKLVFNVCSSICFVLLTWLIYANVVEKKKYDYRLLLLSTMCIWIAAPQFAQTILWLDGSCNYLWGATIILGFVTLYRGMLKKELLSGGNSSTENSEVQGGKRKQSTQIFLAIGMFFFGIIAGWCNENTSGGGLILTILFLVLYRWEDKGKIRPFMFSGIAGQLVGMLIMLTAPGTVARSVMETGSESHTGLMAYISRFLQILNNIYDLFFGLLAICLFLLILCIVQGRDWKVLQTSFSYFLAFGATCFALILTPPTQQRAYFGAGIFLILVLVDLFSLVREDGVDCADLIKTLKTFSVAILVLYFTFVYIHDGANLTRIQRESSERFAYIEEQIANGFDTGAGITVAALHPEFDCKYTCAYEMDLSDDPWDWINMAYEEYYGVGIIRAIPRDEWDELTGY